MPGIAPDPASMIVIAANVGLAILCLTIAGSVLWFCARRHDLPPRYRRIAWLFAGFLGATALAAAAATMDVPAIWRGVIQLAAVTAGAIAVAMLMPRLPRLLDLPSPIKLQAANDLLVSEIDARREAIEQLGAIRRELETRVEDRANALVDSSRRLELALRGTHVTVFNQDSGLRYTWMSQNVLGNPPEWFIGRTDRDLFDEATAARLESYKRAVIETGTNQSFEIMISVPGQEGEHSWFNAQLEPTTAPDGTVTGLIGVAADITEQKRRENHVRLLMRELAHRSKNALAVVQAIARQTASHSQDKAQFLASFSARIDALAASNDLLVSENWSGVDLNALIRSQLGHYVDQIGRQIRLDGPSVRIPAEAVQNIGLAFHELATNAAKYGALSSPQGSVDVTWHALDDIASEGERGRRVSIAWRERGGPPVTRPSRKGFGQVVIERTVARAVSGEVELDYAPEGLNWTLSFTIDREAA